MGKNVPNLYDASHAKHGEVRKGRYVGKCPNCGLVLAEFDLLKDKYKCPTCGKSYVVERLKDQPVAA